MKSASLAEIKGELKNRSQAELLEISLRLARAKKENKELLTYLLFDSNDIDGYISQLKTEINEGLAVVNKHNLYILKKQLRKLLSKINKHLKFTASKTAEAEVSIHFCESLHKYGIPFKKTPALSNIYHAQLKKIENATSTLHEDLQYDFSRKLQVLR